MKSNILACVVAVSCLTGCAEHVIRPLPAAKREEPTAPKISVSSSVSFEPAAVERVAVYAEAQSSGSDSASREISDSTERVLLQKGYRVASRQDLDKVLSEGTFPADRKVGAEVANRLGKLLSCQAIVVIRPHRFITKAMNNGNGSGLHWMGTARPSVFYRTAADVDARIINAADGEVLWRGDISYQEDLASTPIRAEILKTISAKLIGEVPARKN